MKHRILAFAAAVALWPFGSLAQSIDVLWYAYSPPGSPTQYREDMQAFADRAHLLSSGVRWRVTFFGPGERPDFEAYDVLVVESSFAGLFDDAGQADYTGILANEAAITAARGNRTLITGATPDFSLNRAEPMEPMEFVQDGAAGVLANWINWAGSGSGLGVVALDAEESLWWYRPGSFLSGEVNSDDLEYDCCFRDYIPADRRSWPINTGLTDAAALAVTNATVAFKVPPPPGYTTIFASVGFSDEPTAGTVATASEAAGSNVPREEYWCDALLPPLHRPRTLPTSARAMIPVRMRLLDEHGERVDRGDVRDAPLLTVRFGSRVQTIGPFVQHGRAGAGGYWMAMLPSHAISERGTHTMDALDGGSYY
ncbi:MAG: hypothetical protein AVDCRST_MAG71-61 [uncultured Lysobacter sp.]|uniref:Uncharacterized protein n=1 Tax=uncultured Lysobacter sp. TaxID=271060 RepID=A0A6J4KBM2_9GAMM|nr:MAG: hypothetical protein AVDCRST_MAG71-61 [uncultured Lysobacter sp.]